MTKYRILILEDDLDTLSTIMKVLFEFEQENIDIFELAVTVFSEYKEVESYINIKKNIDFDIVLLDRDSKEAGSFHVLYLDKFNKDAIIAISTNPEYNQKVLEHGVTRSIEKNYEDLLTFANKLKSELESIIINIRTQ